jgi:hypothetical protein
MRGVGVGRLQLTEQQGYAFSREPFLQMGQEGILDAQSEGAAAHHQVVDAVLTHPCRADQAISCESILGLNHVELAAGEEKLMTLFQRVAAPVVLNWLVLLKSSSARRKCQVEGGKQQFISPLPIEQ